MKKMPNFLLIATLVFLSGCGLGDQFTQDKREEIINSVNNCIEYSNVTLEKIDNFTEGMIDYEEEVELYKGDKNSRSPSMHCFHHFSAREEESDFVDSMRNPSLSIKEEDRNKLVEQADKYVDIFESLLANCDKLEKYTLAEDFKDDNFSKSDQLVSKINQDIDSFYDLRPILMEILDKIADENDLLKDATDPGGIALRNIDEALKKAEDLYDSMASLYDEEGNEVGQISQVENLNQELIKMIADHTSNKPSGIDALGIQYDHFYNIDMEKNITLTAKKMIRMFNSGEQEDFYSELESLLLYYNNAVDSSNSFSDSRSMGIL